MAAFTKTCPVLDATAWPPHLPTTSIVFQMTRRSWIIVALFLYLKIFLQLDLPHIRQERNSRVIKEKQRSKSPSKATPKSAFSVITTFAVDDLFSVSNGWGYHWEKLDLIVMYKNKICFNTHLNKFFIDRI